MSSSVVRWCLVLGMVGCGTSGSGSSGVADTTSSDGAGAGASAGTTGDVGTGTSSGGPDGGGSTETSANTTNGASSGAGGGGGAGSGGGAGAGSPQSSSSSGAGGAPPSGAYFEMDYTPGAQPNAGFNAGFNDFNGNLDENIAYSLVEGVGPGSANVYQIENIASGAWEGDPGWTAEGLEANFGAQLGPGDTVYFRFYYRFQSQGDGYMVKLIQLQANDGQRQALLLVSYGPDQHRWVGSHGGDIYTDGTRNGWSDVLPDSTEWSYVQAAYTFNDPADTPNGRWRFWLNNDDPNAPTVEIDPVTGDGGLIPGFDDYYVSFWGYHQPGEAATAGGTLQIGGFAMSGEFDAAFGPP